MTQDLDPQGAEQRRTPRYACEHSAELFDAEGRPHSVDLLNISEGGGQVSLSAHAAAALGLPQTKLLPFRIWLPGDAEEAPLEGQARVAYLVPAEDGGDILLVGLDFQDLIAEGMTRVSSFIDTCLRYAE